MPRRKVDPDTLRTLEQRFAKAQQDLRHARSLEKKQARADDARRKIIVGALALEHAEKNPGSDFARVMAGLLKEYVRPEDRPLLADAFRALLPHDEALALLGQTPPKPNQADTAESHMTEAAE